MPTYDYQCSKCGDVFEAFQRMTDAPLEACPQCGGPVKRLIGPGAGFIFRGSGFYITDYRSKDYKAKAKAESGSGAGGDAAKGGAGSKSGSGSGDAKPASAAPPAAPAKSD